MKDKLWCNTKKLQYKVTSIKTKHILIQSNELNKQSEKNEIIKTKRLRKDCNKSIVFLIVKNIYLKMDYKII